MPPARALEPTRGHPACFVGGTCCNWLQCRVLTVTWMERGSVTRGAVEGPCPEPERYFFHRSVADSAAEPLIRALHPTPSSHRSVLRRPRPMRRPNWPNATHGCAAHTLALTAPLSAEDLCVQSMPDASPGKWHLAHTSWFFETVVLQPHVGGYRVFDPVFGYLFNSYYEALGARHPRPERGLLTRPSLNEVMAYREHVDQAMQRFLSTGAEDGPDWRTAAKLVMLGLQHEQQHQELLLTDALHLLSCNPLLPAYRAAELPMFAAGRARARPGALHRPARRRNADRSCGGWFCVRQRDPTPPRAAGRLRDRGPARDLRRVCRLHRRRRLPPARTVAVRRLVRGAHARLERAGLLAGAGRSAGACRPLAGVRLARRTACCAQRAGQPVEFFTRPPRLPNGRVRGCPPNSSGKRRSMRRASPR